MFNRVHEYRKKRNKSQKEVANAVGITRQTVSLIELGKYNPSLKLCVALAQYLETDLNTLFWRV
ncbi:helix-turn-helix transcriptional regulator [Lactobacillus taiwanensis]|uniref:helix-turn-helix transcriptional regulator n=1 Tax=Lactobacillus taiwanensis TaxID=508451 RepID=UPI0032204CD5